MKRIFTFAIALMSMLVVLQSASALVYNATVPAGTNTCYIAGAMNGWSPSASAMTKVDATHFTIEFAAALVTDEYKYCSGPDWKYEETDAAGVKLTTNRTWTASDVVARWLEVYIPDERDVLIEVLTPLTTKVCYIVGNFNNWTPDANQMTKGETTVDGVVFSATVHTMSAPGLEFKFCAGPAWAYGQTSDTNFKYATDGAVVVVNSFKAIFDPALTGTINITASVPAGTDKVWIVGALGWDMAKAVAGVKNVDGTFTFTVPMVMSIEYRCYNQLDWNHPEVGVANPTTELPNRTAVYPTDANISINVWGWKAAPSAVEKVSANNYKIYTAESSIVVEGVASKVELFDIAGRRMQSEKMVGTFTSKALKAGLYVVRVDGATKKVSVR